MSSGSQFYPSMIKLKILRYPSHVQLKKIVPVELSALLIYRDSDLIFPFVCIDTVEAVLLSVFPIRTEKGNDKNSAAMPLQ